jgi:hypothetical protein
VLVLEGSIPYSAVTQPCSLASQNGGTPSDIEAEQMTFVFPADIKTDPAGCSR